MKPSILMAALAAATTATNHAAILLTPTGVTTNTTGDTFPIGNLINNSGFDSTPTIGNYATTTQSAGNSDGTKAWVTSSIGSGDYFASRENPVLVFDLGGTHELTSFIYWGYNNGGTGNEAKSFTLTFSTTGTDGTFTGSQSFSSDTAIGIGIPAEFSLAQVTANAVRIEITDNYHGINTGGDRVGLGEVKFIAIPEPATVLLGSMGLLALLRRRRA